MSEETTVTVQPKGADGVAGDGKKEDEKAEDLPSCGIKELFQFADKWDYVLYVLGTIAAIVNGMTMPAFSLIFGELLDSFNQAGGTTDIMDDIKPLALYISLAGVAAWVFSYLEVALFQIAAERQGRKLRDAYFAALLNQNVGWFDKQSTEALVTKVADESRTFIDGIGSKLGLGLRCFTTFVGGFVLAFIQGWQLTLVLCAMAPLMAVGGALMMKLMADIEGESARMYAEAGAIAQERLSAIRTVQAFGGQQEAQDKYGKHLDVTLKAGIKQGFVSGGSMGFTIFVMFAMFGVAFWYGSTLVAGDREDILDDLAALGCPADADFSITCTDAYKAANPGACASFCDTHVFPCLNGDTCESGGNVVLVFFAVLIGAMGIGQANPSAVNLAKARVAGYQVFSVIHRKVPISAVSDEGRKIAKADVRGTIRFRNVHFAYPSRPDRKVLDGLNLDIEAGTTVALVGRSGCGKSTVISLIQRFYDPTSGSVELDDLGALTQLNVRSLRATMGLVGQEPILFATSVKDNIKFGVAGTHNATDAEIEGAARLANAHNFIMEFEQHYDTMVGGRGAALSGGQKQRVAIARAVVRRPKVLLLDEATSALDSQSEVVVQEALNGLMASSDHTTVVIAHRLSTIKNADKIVVMDNGKVVEQGTHEELMAIEDGIYCDLVHAQMSGRDGALTELDDGSKAESKRDGSDGSDGPVPRGKSASMSRDRAGTMSASKAASEVKEVDPDVDTSIKRIFKMSLPEWPWIIVAFIAAMVYGSQNPLFAVAFSEMITLLFEPNIEKMEDDSLFWGLGFLVLAVVAGVAAIFMFGAFGVLGQSLGRRLRASAFKAMLHKDMAYHDDEENSTGALSTQLATDATLVNAMASQRAAIMAQNLVSMSVGLAIAFVADWRLSLVVLGVGPILVLAGDLQMRAYTGQTQKVQKSLEQAGQVVEESVHGIRTVASFDLANEMCVRYRERLVEPQRQGIKGGHTSGFGFGFSQFAMFGVYGLTFFVGGLWVEDGSLTFADMMLVMMAIMMTAMALGESSSMAPDATKAQHAINNIFTTLDKTPTIDPEFNKPRTKTCPPHVQGAVEFRDIVFSYPTREGRVLSHFNLKVPAGSSVALVGSSGSGKSTIVQLMQRFYDPDNASGLVTLDGRDIRTLDVQWLRRQLGVVSQEPTLFNGTVAENIAYGKAAFGDDADLGPLVEVELFSGEDAGEVGSSRTHGPSTRAPVGTQKVHEAIVRAAKDANAHNFISQMPEGYHTVIKPDSLSGGQKQRVAIARAILRDPPILLLDEATSALDNRSEQVVQEALDRLMAQKRCTTIVVAHRLSTIYQSDQIVVMHKGEIVEQGTHDYLISNEAPRGKYRTMWEQQNLLGAGASTPN